MSALDRVTAWPVSTVAAGYVDSYGECRTIGPAATPLPLASVTKALFAYVVLIAIEEGTLALDQPAGPGGATVRHLLSHSSGLPAEGATPISEVARRRIYSNAGFEILGRELETASGLDPATYFHEALVAPLGLQATALAGSVAHGARSSVDDLLKVAGEWLHPTLVAAETLAAATSPQLGDLPGVLPGYGRQEVNSWGLGFELKGTKAPHWTGQANSAATFGHFGRAGTFVWVDPQHRVGCAVLTDREFGSWAMRLWPELSDAVVAEATQAESTPGAGSR
jgi:CubicO group peptidase (beta-lactamase class C family)